MDSFTPRRFSTTKNTIAPVSKTSLNCTKFSKYGRPNSASPAAAMETVTVRM